MSGIREITTRWLVLTLALLCCALSIPAASLAAEPTAEQLRMLQSLSPEDQVRLLQSLGTGPGALPQSAPQEGLVLDPRLGSLRASPAQPVDLTPRLEAGSSFVITFTLDSTVLDSPGRGQTEPMLDGLPLSRNLQALPGSTVHVLDRDGILVLQGIYRIPLAGLSAEEAAQRIAAEPGLESFEVEVVLLPLTDTGRAALELYGRNLFGESPSTFAPASNIPVPADYRIGPGDSFIVALFGKENREYELVVNRDGQVVFPGIGTIAVAGLTFDESRAELGRRISEQMIGVRASVTMGALRTINVLVLGDAEQPGSYTVSGLATITNALFASGGIAEQGSMRRILHKRNGAIVGRLDLYDLLLSGDSRGDQRLQSGDVIFVEPVGATAGVQGQVVRPALYELGGERTIDQLIELAGGLLPTAFGRNARMERITDDGRHTYLDIDLGTRTGRATVIQPGDYLYVDEVLDETRDGITLSGHVFRPGGYQYRSGMRLSDLLPNYDLLRPGADFGYVLIRREKAHGEIVAMSVDLRRALGAPRSSADPELAPRDRVMVFDISDYREIMVQPLIEEMAAQVRDGRPIPEVGIGGRVVAPGRYPLEPGMRLSDLLRAGGQLQEAAYTLDAELTRYAVVNGESRQSELIVVDLAGVLAGNASADLLLQAHDYINVKEIPQWSDQEQIAIQGEVRFPGDYPIHRGETLRSVLDRAGGLTDLAFPAGSVFVRKELKKREQEQLEALASRLESDLVTFSLQALQEDGDATDVLTLGQSLLGQLRSTRATGRLVIDLASLLNDSDATQDIVLKDGDELYIPKQTQEVTVLGEVQYTTSHIFQPGLARDDYISRSGGLTQKADEKRIYIVRANGAVVSSSRSAWFRRSHAGEIQAGDTVVVPLDADRMAPLTLWSNISQIVYQLALAAASANAVGVF